VGAHDVIVAAIARCVSCVCSPGWQADFAPDLLRDDEQMTQVAAYGTRTAACATRGIPPPISHAHANNFGTDVSCQQSLQWRQE
jgi:hypothetical protein